MPPPRGRRWSPRRIGQLPSAAGVYVLYQRTKRVGAARTFNLRRALEGAARRGPAFTYFDWYVVRREEDRARLAATLAPPA
jgi:hypothetical protein